MAKQATTTALGIPSKSDLLLQRGQADTVPAVINNSKGLPQKPAQISEGEFIFSVPAIMALGGGDHALGTEKLTEIHDALRAKAAKMFGEEKIAGGLNTTMKTRN